MKISWIRPDDKFESHALRYDTAQHSTRATAHPATAYQPSGLRGRGHRHVPPVLPPVLPHKRANEDRYSSNVRVLTVYCYRNRETRQLSHNENVQYMDLRMDQQRIFPSWFTVQFFDRCRGRTRVTLFFETIDRWTRGTLRDSRLDLPLQPIDLFLVSLVSLVWL